jgi:hypothetical protein
LAFLVSVVITFKLASTEPLNYGRNTFQSKMGAPVSCAVSEVDITGVMVFYLKFLGVLSIFGCHTQRVRKIASVRGSQLSVAIMDSVVFVHNKSNPTHFLPSHLDNITCHVQNVVKHDTCDLTPSARQIIMQGIHVKSIQASNETSGDMLVPVQNLASGKQTGVVVGNPASVSSLKKAIQDTLGTPAHLQRLFIAGVELLDSKPFVLDQFATVHLVVRDPVTGAEPMQRGVIFAKPCSSYPTYNGDGVVYATNGPWEVDSRTLLLYNVPSLTRRQADRLVRVHWHARLVKILAIIDMLFLLPWSISYWPFFFGFFASVCGYIGASHYDPCLVCIYFLWDLTQMILRIYWIVERTHEPEFVALTVICLIIELWLMGVVLRLFDMLTRVSEQDKFVLESVLDRDYTFWTGPVHVRLVESHADTAHSKYHGATTDVKPRP